MVKLIEFSKKMLQLVKKALLGDFLKNFDAKKSEIQDSEDPEIKQLQYTLRLRVLLKIPLTTV